MGKEAYWIIFCSDTILLTEEKRLPIAKTCPLHLEVWQTVITLPELNGRPCFSVQISTPITQATFTMMSLRQSYYHLPFEEYLMAGKARELQYWDTTTKFCGVCGSPMKSHTTISKRCINCGKEIWPSLATAIIVAITRGEEILLIQSRNFTANYMGLVAGFVETGESLEECVHREVLEETGLKIKNLSYFASQPWPYPSGLMVGFKAEYDSGQLCLQRSELRKGGWYRFDALPEIPGPMSLARILIDDWLRSFSIHL
ncbi:NAD(+) diphosphatase [Alloprevotella tannerae]|jgi:NAD(+) diphosphatase|uniref:NAD(+) diphosphatase n=1 Tax=Alloprevotella tannerae TaxID=76122 RepID=UPI001CAC7AD7|nr:NAD(+) diphosphatase [Alloprevotella tannerae]MBF0953144.1 NAD(+) diphosphatase [Alloprevotella tannerae]